MMSKYGDLSDVSYPKNSQLQHLYITTEDKIKEGDWFIDNFDKLFQANRNYIQNGYCAGDKHFKIVATTDKSLGSVTYDGIDKRMIPIHTAHFLPQPSKAFIEKYCKVGGIDEVLIEYYNGCHLCEDDKSQCLSLQKQNVTLEQDCDTFWKLKVNSHNEITIHPIKENYTREEINELCDLYEAIIHGDFHIMTKKDIQDRIKELKN